MTYLYLPGDFDVSVLIGDFCTMAFPVVFMALLVTCYFIIKEVIKS
jgi:hypothetical protein